MSWLSSAIDKGRKALGLPVISTANAGAIVKKVAGVAAPFVPGGAIITNAVSRFSDENAGKSAGEIVEETAQNLWGAATSGVQTVQRAAAVQQTAYDVTHSSTTVIILAVVVVLLLFRK